MIEFDPKTHQYRVAGVVFPSVTQVLKGVGIIDVRWYKPGSAERGAMIHEVLELIDLDMMDGAFIDPDIVGYVNAYDKFKYDTGAKILEIEKIVAHEDLMYAGRLDRIIELNGKRMILDIKTGYPEDYHGVQLAAYRMALGENIDTACLYLTREGKYKLKEYDSKYYSVVFVSAINLWRYLNGKRTDYSGDEEGIDY